MKLNDYQEWTRSTAIYGHANYPWLGLAEEVGELLGLFAKASRDRTPLDSNKVIKEAGDVLWMLARITDDFGFSLEDIAKANIEKLESRKERNKLQGSGDDR